MSIALQRQIDLMKKRLDTVEEDNKKLKAENQEINRQLDILLNQFQTRMAAAIDKVIGEGIQVEELTESQIARLMQ